MNNNVKRGFTLVEILVVIVLISLILGLGIPGIMKINENAKKRSYNTKVDMIESSAVVWGNDNKTLLKKEACDVIENNATKKYDCYKISVAKLITEDYLNSEKIGEIVYNNPENDETLLNNCVYVYKKNNKVYSYFENDINISKCDNYDKEGNLLTTTSTSTNTTTTTTTTIVVKKPVITASDNITSGKWHKANFILTFSGEEGTEIFYGTTSTSLSNKGTTYDATVQTASKSIYVKACKSKKCSELASYVIKLDKTPPTITYNTSYVSSGKVNLSLNDSYNLKNYVKVTDNLTKSSSINITNTSFSGTSSVGTQSIIYKAEDLAGNTASKILTIYVDGYPAISADPYNTNAFYAVNSSGNVYHYERSYGNWYSGKIE